MCPKYTSNKFPLLVLINKKVKPFSLDLKKTTLSLNREETNNQYALQNNAQANQQSIQQRTMDDYNTSTPSWGLQK